MSIFRLGPVACVLGATLAASLAGVAKPADAQRIGGVSKNMGTYPFVLQRWTDAGRGGNLLG
jgi:hypothetical protein